MDIVKPLQVDNSVFSMDMVEIVENVDIVDMVDIVDVVGFVFTVRGRARCVQ